MDTRSIKPIRLSPKPLMLLKDHLLDDMSSCSSNGFKSFPRRQCCTTVRFLHDSDHHRRNKLLLQHHKTYASFKPPPPKTALSAIHSVIAAVKRLQFGAAISPEKKKKKKINSFLPRSLSRRIFRKGSFWKRKTEAKEIAQWKTFDQILKEDSKPSDHSIATVTDDGKSYSWSGSDFTASEGGNSSSEVNSNLSDEKNDVVIAAARMLEEKGNDHEVGVVNVLNDNVSAESTICSNGSSNTNSSTGTKKQWRSDQEKEQFSPVSVLDCPFEDDDEVSSSPFQHRRTRMEGSKQKTQRLECLATLEPTNLTTRFASERSSDDESSHPPLLHSSFPSIDEEHEQEEGDKDEEERKPGELLMEWEVEKNRQAYIKDMEKGGEWRTLDQENEEVVLELGNEVFDALLGEMFADIIS